MLLLPFIMIFVVVVFFFFQPSSLSLIKIWISPVLNDKILSTTGHFKVPLEIGPGHFFVLSASIFCNMVTCIFPVFYTC